MHRRRALVIFVNSVVALVSAIRLDVHVQAIPIISGGVDPVNAFLANVPPMPRRSTRSSPR